MSTSDLKKTLDNSTATPVQDKKEKENGKGSSPSNLNEPQTSPPSYLAHIGEPETKEDKAHFQQGFLEFDRKPLLQKDGSLGTILIACHVPPFGQGDIAHFIRYMKEVKLSRSCDGFKFLGLITCTDYQAADFQKELQTHNMSDTVVVSHESTNKLKQALRQQYQQNSAFKKSMQSVTQVHNISTPQMQELLPEFLKPGVPIFNTGEQGGCTANAFEDPTIVLSEPYRNDIFNRNMGFALNHHGIRLGFDKSLLHRDMTSRARSLASIEDKRFLGYLFTEQQLQNLDEKTCADFLRTTLFIPGRFQAGPHSFAALALGVCTSKLVKERCYQRVVFVTNDVNREARLDNGLTMKLTPNFAIEAFSNKFLQDKNIQLVHIDANGKRLQTNLAKVNLGLDTKPVLQLILIDHWFAKGEDYIRIVNAAEDLFGCSGDGGMEDALKFGMLPLYQPHKYKINFLGDLIELLREHQMEKLIKLFKVFQKELPEETLREMPNSTPKTQKEWVIKVANIIAEQLDNEVLKEWTLMLDIFHKDYNFSLVVPFIIDERIYFTLVKALKALDSNHTQIPLIEEHLKKLNAIICARADREFCVFLDKIRKNQVEKTFVLIRGCFSREQWQAIFKELENNTYIDELVISNDETLINGWDALVEMMGRNNFLKSLILTNLKINDAMLEKLIKHGLAKNRSLIELDLNGNLIGVECQGLQALGNFVTRRDVSLKTLHLMNNRIGHTVVNSLQELIKNSSLTTIVLENNPIQEPTAINCQAREMLASLYLQPNNSFKGNFPFYTFDFSQSLRDAVLEKDEFSDDTKTHREDLMRAGLDPDNMNSKEKYSFDDLMKMVLAAAAPYMQGSDPAIVNQLLQNIVHKAAVAKAQAQGIEIAEDIGMNALFAPQFAMTEQRASQSSGSLQTVHTAGAPAVAVIPAPKASSNPVPIPKAAARAAIVPSGATTKNTSASAVGVTLGAANGTAVASDLGTQATGQTQKTGKHRRKKK